MSTSICFKEDNKFLEYKTKLSDGRHFTISDSSTLVDQEYMIIVESKPIISSKIPVLLRKKIIEISFFTKVDNRYVYTEINKKDAFIIQLLISSTKLSNFNVLFAKHVNVG